MKFGKRQDGKSKIRKKQKINWLLTPPEIKANMLVKVHKHEKKATILQNSQK